MSGGRRNARPRVSVGLPVYNGEDFLAEAVDSVLGQTLTDFELIISDNASTDATEFICRAAAVRDERVRYVRNRINIGAGPNQNRVFELSRGEFFKLQAHDDILHPDFLARCVEALDNDHEIVCAFTSTIDIDPQGRVIKKWGPRPGLCAPTPGERCWDALSFVEEPFAIFGVARANVWATTGLMGSFPSADKVLLAELVMRGPFLEVEEPLFLHREHPLRSVHVAGVGHASMAWWDPRLAGAFKFPYWRMFRNLAAAINRTPMSQAERLRCYGALLRWVPDNGHWLKLVYDAAIPARPLLDRIWSRMSPAVEV